MPETSYATSEAILDLLNTASPTSARERTLAIAIAVACLGLIIAALLLAARYLPVF
jgi:hypothetical protein